MSQTAIRSSLGRDRALSSADFRRIAASIQREAGIELPDSKRNLAQSRILKRLRHLGMTNFGDYCDFIEQPDNAAERMEMLSVLTTNVTGFFREKHHFSYLDDHCIPALLRRLRGGGSVRVWSAGCSTGEEPYSIALTFLRAMPDIQRYDFKIIATDIDPSVLNYALAGEYADDRLSAVPADLRSAHFAAIRDEPGQFQISPTLRKIVTIRQLNLISPWPFSRKFDVIFCRNVVIYFDAATKTQVWQKLIAQLAPDGVLMTGHSERLSGDSVRDLDNVATTTYRTIVRDKSEEGKN